ncbi:MAG TPA: translation initiation factor IF-3 [Methylococcaceae bacterium]|nr:translation initiation factor IF-3 [Methylococcaceae bacterium]
MTANDRKEPRLNDEITWPQVRLIGPDGQQLGIVSSREAKQIAFEAELDLVEISPSAEPPVCRVMDYGKYRFEQSKKLQAAKKKQKLIHIKEVKFRPGTDEGDYQIKLRNLIRFLNDGDKAKITVRFRGRELSHRELGMDLLKRIETDLQEYATVEQFPKLEGKQLSMTLSPKKKKT